LSDQPSLDFGGKRFDDGQGAAAFGRVVAGLVVVQQIQRRPTEGQNLTPPIRIISATRVMRRDGLARRIARGADMVPSVILPSFRVAVSALFD